MPDLDERTWKERLGPALERSVDRAEETITRTPDVQAWVRTASYRAAMSVGYQGDIESAAAAYGYMLDDLRERFPSLVAAVHDLTAGCARLDLHWRPLSPQYSRVRLDFGTDFGVLNYAYALEQLRHVRAPVLGTVLNDLDVRRAAYAGAGSAYSSYYGRNG